MPDLDNLICSSLGYRSQTIFYYPGNVNQGLGGELKSRAAQPDPG